MTPKTMRSQLSLLAKLDMGRVRRRTSRKARSIKLPKPMAGRFQERRQAHSVLRLAIHFSRVAWLLGSIVVKAIPIPEFGVE